MCFLVAIFHLVTISFSIRAGYIKYQQRCVIGKVSCLGGLFIYQVAVDDSGDLYALLPTVISVGDEIGNAVYLCTRRC